jgi:hypothetical protein
VTDRPSSPWPAAGRHAAGRLAGIAGGVLWSLALAAPAAAHGEVTGVQDVIQDYGVLLFLVATVLIGAGVLAWVTFSPQPDEDEEEAAVEGAAPAPRAVPVAGDAAEVTEVTRVAETAEAVPAPAGPARPEGSRASR